MTNIHLIQVPEIKPRDLETSVIDKVNYLMDVFPIDTKLTEKIDEIHRQQTLDYLFVEDFSQYRLLLRDCKRRGIKTKKTGLISITDKFNLVYFYAGDLENMAHIVYKDEIEKLKNLYQQAGFVCFLSFIN